jgi:hypothetical protein
MKPTFVVAVILFSLPAGRIAPEAKEGAEKGLSEAGHGFNRAINASIATRLYRLRKNALVFSDLGWRRAWRGLRGLV